MNTYLVINRRWLMNYKKLIVLASLFPLLAACAGNSYYGKYSFQMGKNKDTHIGVDLELTKEAYDAENPDKGEKFSISFDIKTSDVEDAYSEILKEVTPLTGYYKVDKKVKVDEGNLLNIGINLLGEYEVPQTITDGIFIANITGNVVNFYLPVSFEDLRYQLYWYGYDLSGENIMAAIMGDEEEVEDPIASVDGKHSLDVHPTKEQIAAINEHYPASHDGEQFRDYHVLKLGLLKK